MGAMLGALGYDILMAHDGREAVEVFSQECHRIDLVILDLRMPHMDGHETFLALRRIDPDVRVLISTGMPSDEPTSLVNHGAIGCLQKPFHVVDLSHAVADALRDAVDTHRRSP
jgi:DNA-binding NtrC family response regulator